jgi:hypothetical protein
MLHNDSFTAHLFDQELLAHVFNLAAVLVHHLDCQVVLLIQQSLGLLQVQVGAMKCTSPCQDNISSQ